MTAMLLILAAAASGQAPGPKADAPAQAAARLSAMKAAAGGYEFAREAGPIRLQPEPAFRLGNQSNGVLEGAIFLWNDKDGRPEAAAQVFLHRDRAFPEGKWIHEFTSLSTTPMTASRKGAVRWSPDGPGVTFRGLPGAPKPAATPAQRLRQMRALAEEFKAEDDFGAEGRIVALRLLTTPVARYGKAGATPEDGALFAFVEGTDPEVFLFVEARPGKDGLEWQYACAPMSCWPLKATHKGRIVWEVPRRWPDNPSRTFFSLDDLPETESVKAEASR